MLLWPTVTVLGFAVLAGLVIALGRGSTARYEYERNCVAGQRHEPATVPAAVAGPADGAAGGSAGTSPVPQARGQAAAAPARREQPAAVGVAAHPAGRRTVARDSVTAWWLVDEAGDEPVARVVAGPFADRFEADWAAVANGLAASTRPVHGVQRADGTVVHRQSSQERAWLHELGAQLARLPEDWDELLTDTDALTTLVVEVGAALVEAGLPLHDCAGLDAEDGSPAGGVCLTPDVGSAGILVSWHRHDRMSLQQVRGAAVDAAVQRTMNAAIAQVLAQLGFQVESLGPGGCHRVTAPTAELI